MKYTITSYEPEGAYDPKIVNLHKQTSCGERDDYFWAEVAPPFEGRLFGLGDDLSVVLLAPRFEGDSIIDTQNWPLHVYVCTTTSPDNIKSDVVPVDDVKILNWGLLDPI